MRKEQKKARRKKSIRKRISGTSEKPRLCIHKSLKNLYAQVVDDVDGKTLCGLSTCSKAIKTKGVSRKNIDAANMLGEEIAKIAVTKGLKKVVFDRSGYKYHGVVKAFADTARKNGLEF